MENNKKGFVAIVVFFLIIAVAVAVMPMIMNTASFDAINEPAKALYIAESGIRYYAQHELQGSTDWTTKAGIGPVSFGGGTFSIAIVGPSPREKERIIVRSTGASTAGTHVFTRVIERTITTGADAFDSPLYGMGPINIDNSGTVNGDIISTGSVTIKKGQENVNGEILQNESSAQIPQVDWAYWQTKANTYGAGHVITGDLTSAPAASGVYYVQGNVVIDSPQTWTFNGTIVATGNITIKNNNLTYTAVTGAPAFIAGNDFLATGINKINMTGSIYAVRNLTINIVAAQGSSLSGSLIFGGTCNIGQANNATFNIDPSASSDGFTGGAGGTKLSGYREL